MARRDLISFGPGDVLEVVVRCGNCGSGISIAVMRAQAVVPGVSYCIGCRAAWDLSEDYRDHLEKIGQLLDSLRYFSNDRPPWAVEMMIEDR